MSAADSSSRPATSSGRLSATRWPLSITSTSSPRRSDASRRRNASGKRRSWRAASTRVGTSRPRVERPRIGERRVGLARLAAREQRGDDLRRDVVQERGRDVERRVGIAALAHVELPRGRLCPLLAHHAPGVSPGAGIIGATSTSCATSARSQAIEAGYAPIDCATSVTASRPSIAATTASAYSASPARSSAAGRSGVRASWPRSRSLAAT